jgi:hypothetical protein
VVARAVVYHCSETREYLFCIPDVTGRKLAIGAPLPGFPELVVVELSAGSGLLPAYLRAARREYGAWCVVGVAEQEQQGAPPREERRPLGSAQDRRGGARRVHPLL